MTSTPEDGYRPSSVTDGPCRAVVITGCSGGGKSTLLAELGRRGHRVFPEAGRQIVREQDWIGGDARPGSRRRGSVSSCCRAPCTSGSAPRRSPAWPSLTAVWSSRWPVWRAWVCRLRTILSGRRRFVVTTRRCSSPRPGRIFSVRTPSGGMGWTPRSRNTPHFSRPTGVSAIAWSSCRRSMWRRGPTSCWPSSTRDPDFPSPLWGVWPGEARTGGGVGRYREASGTACRFPTLTRLTPRLSLPMKGREDFSTRSSPGRPGRHRASHRPGPRRRRTRR